MPRLTSAIAAQSLLCLLGCRQALGIEDLVPGAASAGGSGGESAGGQGGGGEGATGGGGTGGQAGAGCAYRDAVMADAPVAYWRFGESAGSEAVDEIGSTPGTYFGDVTLGVPGIGCGDTAIELHGTASEGYVDVGDVFDFDGVTELSIELWVNPGRFTGSYQGLVHNYDANGIDGYELALPPEGPAFERQDVPLAADDPIPVGSFSHVVATFNGTTMALYVNGVRKTLIDSTTVAENDRPLRIGDRYMQNVLLGVLDEVALYDRALSDIEVTDHFNAR